MRFLLFVEGHTERKCLPRFLKSWLDPQLSKPVGIQSVRFDGWAELVKDVAIKSRMHLEGPVHHEIIAIISLIDLYGPTIYPDGIQRAEDRDKWIKQHIESLAKHPKFRHFCAIHETEAWLLSQPELLPREVRDALPAKAKEPEKVNFDEPPSSLLERLYSEKLRRSYKKVTDGKILFDKLDPAVAYGKCPSLRRLVDEMLNLAREAGL